MADTYFEEAFALQEKDLDAAPIGQTPYTRALGIVRQQMTERFRPDQLARAGPDVTDEATRLASQVYVSFNDRALRENRARVAIDPDLFIRRALADILGMGPIEPLLEDETIEDIAINGPNEVMVYRNGGWEETDIHFE